MALGQRPRGPGGRGIGGWEKMLSSHTKITDDQRKDLHGRVGGRISFWAGEELRSWSRRSGNLHAFGAFWGAAEKRDWERGVEMAFFSRVAVLCWKGQRTVKVNGCWWSAGMIRFVKTRAMFLNTKVA